MNKIKGKVKFFNEDKGYGFIRPDEGGDDVFVHITAVRNSHYDSLAQDDAVEFDTEEGKSGKTQVANLKIIN